MFRTIAVSLGLLLVVAVLTVFWQLRQELSPQPLLSQQRSAQPPLTPFQRPGAPPPAFSPLPPSPAQTATTAPLIAIIIDDLGNHWRNDLRTLNLKGHVTLAILPFSVHGKKLAVLAQQKGREVMLHAPMEPISHDAWRGGLSRSMNPTEMRESLRTMLDFLPQIKGVNNHMGSALTQEAAAMDLVMQELVKRGLYFVDSRTTPRSLALARAKRHAVPSDDRDIFLDHVRDEKYIARAFQRLLDLSRQRGRAIAIGHPYPETLAFLEAALPELEESGVRLVPISEILQISAYANAPAQRSEGDRSNPASPRNSI